VVHRIVFAFCVFGLSAFGQKQPDSTAWQGSSTLSQVLDQRLAGVEHLLMTLAEAMPDEKYGFAPSSGAFKDMRSFAGQIKHTAFVNYVLFSDLSGEPIPQDDGSEDGPPNIKTKAALLEYLRDSFSLGHRAIAAIDDQNAVTQIKSRSKKDAVTTRLALAMNATGHCFMHYGELLIYMRISGISPPD
jgi:DinB superfamily